MPYFSPLPDTLLVDGTDIQSLTGIVVGNFDGLFAPGIRRGSNLTIPGLSGDLAVTGRPYAAYSFDIPITVLGENSSGVPGATDQQSRAYALANLNAIAAVLAPGIVTLTRRLATASGYVSHTCTGEFISGLQLTFFLATTGNTVLQFLNLDGSWFDAAAGAVVVP